MAIAVCDYLIAVIRLRFYCNVIRHGARWDEDGCLFSQHSSNHVLEFYHSGIVAPNIVPDCGFCHDLPHWGGWLGNCVAPQIYSVPGIVPHGMRCGGISHNWYVFGQCYFEIKSSEYMYDFLLSSPSDFFLFEK